MMIIIQNATTATVRFQSELKPQGDTVPKQNSSPVHQAPDESWFSGENQQ